MENNESYKLTDEEQKEISETLVKEQETSIIDFPGKIESPEETEGESIMANVVINPETGEKHIEPTQEEVKSTDTVLSEFGKSVEEASFFSEDYTIEKEDVIEAAKEQASAYDADFNISDKTALEFVSLLNTYKNTNKVSYKDLPEEAKKYIDDFLKKNGVAGFSKEANHVRNMYAELLVDGMKTNIEINKIDGEFQNKLENMFTDLNNELSPLFMDYNNSKEETLRKMQEKVEDPEKKKLIEDILDTIHRTFTLEDLIAVAPNTKIKAYNLEKPEKVFRDIHVKYEGSNYNIYDLRLCCNVLDKHLKQNEYLKPDDKYSVIKALLVFTKYVKNYSVDNPVEHSFIYYTLYNMILLEVYHGEEYEKYSKEYLPNVMKLINSCR